MKPPQCQLLSACHYNDLWPDKDADEVEERIAAALKYRRDVRHRIRTKEYDRRCWFDITSVMFFDDLSEDHVEKVLTATLSWLSPAHGAGATGALQCSMGVGNDDPDDAQSNCSAESPRNIIEG